MRITTDHPASSYGIPVILDDQGEPMNHAAGLKAVRLRLGMSQAQLGAIVGKSWRTIGNYEQGRNAVPTEVLNVVADMLGRA